MILIQEILVSDDVFDNKFHCHLAKCKGACCRAGDFGAPLEEQEIELIEKAMSVLKKYLSKKALLKIETEGFYKKYSNRQFDGTQILDDGSCVFLREDEQGQLKCMIERAHEDENINFQKPISCQLYPIRLLENLENGFTAINYDQWDICNDACKLGVEMGLPVFRFVKNAIVRKFGIQFYEEMEEAFSYINEKEKNN